MCVRVCARDIETSGQCAMRVFPADSEDEAQALAAVEPHRRRRRFRLVTDAQFVAAASDDDDAHDEEEDDDDTDHVTPDAIVPLALSYDTLCDVVDATFQELRAFRLSGRAVSSGARVMGWQDARRIDGTRVKFQLRKRFASSSVVDLTAKTWQWLSEPEPVLRLFNSRARVQTLQRVNDDLQIAVHDALSADGEHAVRYVYVLCRMRTPRGFIICLRSFNPTASASSDPNVLFESVLGWFRFDATHGSSEHYSSSSSSGSSSESDIERRRASGGVRVECAGSLDFGESDQASSLAMSSLWVALQWESLVVAPLFDLSI
ncbi:hypothetical protein Poli38472_014195 [Pythium oligandrum]|uniref:Uncharacterized protein n=1 Tax=Pythium oligandrum TaxID=41045 RepID=A0A8K1FMX6_PYTOL|nr:hypothetical protein Poli38472_014195 [Pythium oligandrum]|eukprot:TMW64078.1 hypothetical protein Poli38472_014195 [Pythium oligandrum]